MLKAVIFDMDGVIIDSEPLYKAVEKELFRQVGIDVPPELHMKYVGIKTSRMWRDMKELFGLEQSAEELTLMERELYSGYLSSWKDMKPIAGITSLLEELQAKNVKTAIASSSASEEIEAVVSRLGLENCIKVRLSGEQVPRGKPDPDLFIRTAQLLGESPYECAVIEDSENGVAAAKRAGMVCIGYRNPNSGNQDLRKADIIVESIEEITVDRIAALFL